MPQSLASIHIHLIFGTKNRKQLITDDVRNSLHCYIDGILRNHGSVPIVLNSVEDHIHLLFNLGRWVSISKAVEEIKEVLLALDKNEKR